MVFAIKQTKATQSVRTYGHAEEGAARQVKTVRETHIASVNGVDRIRFEQDAEGIMRAVPIEEPVAAE